MDAIAQNTIGLRLLLRLNLDRILMVFAIGLALVGGHALGTIIGNF